MTKEVKLGLAIGGILLSVLLVYILVVSGDPATPGVTLELPTERPTVPETPVAALPNPPAKVETPPAEITTPAPQPPPQIAEAKPDPATDPWIRLLTEGMKPTETPSIPQPEQPVTFVQDPPQAPVSIPAPPPVQPERTPPASDTARPHTVTKGETFYSISAAAYGSSGYFAHLVRANPGIDPGKLKPGMIVNIPPESQVRADRTPRVEQTRVVDDRSEYRVQGGDSLYKISMNLYGKPDRQDKLYEANKATIGADKTKLRPGQVLKLPEAPIAKPQ